MGSRIRERPDKLFEVFMEIGKPAGENETPFVIQKYPDDYEDEEAQMMIPKFAFPCQTDVSTVDHFTFVLTDIDSMFRFAHCRHTTGHQTCLILLSWLPWFEIFYKMLDKLAEMTNSSRGERDVMEFLQATHSLDVPAPNIPVTIVANEEMFNFTSPDTNVLPSIPKSRNLTEYYNAVDTSNMMTIFASMLHERRIFMTSKKLSRITACIHAAEALLYPMHWQHLYIPILPAHLIDYISAPMPYLIGVHSSLLEKLKANRVDVADAVVVDLDDNKVTTEYDDLNDLPDDVSSFLKKNLKKEVVTNSMLKNGDAISSAFMQALVKLIGGYRCALIFRSGEPITFNPEAFVQSRSSQSTQAFLEGMLSLQIFQQFILNRLQLLNAGEGFADIFENEAGKYEDKLNSQSRYREWIRGMKKSSKKGKEVWNGLKIKVLTELRSNRKIKSQSKKAMTDIKTRISEITENEDKKFQPAGGTTYTKPDRTRPVTTHEPSSLRDKPPRPPPPTKYISGPAVGRHSVTRDNSTDDSQLRLSYTAVDVSLMDDSDIQAAMNRSASAEILPKLSENSSLSSTPSSSSLAEDAIPFTNLPSSDEENSMTEDTSSQPVNSLGGDKLILTRPKSVSVAPPIAPPRYKRSPALPHKNTTPKNQPSSKNETSVTQNKDALLIKFDSSESESAEMDIFDPLTSGTEPRSENENNDNFEDRNENFERNRGSRSSLSRSKAFRRQSSKNPVRTISKDDPDEDLIEMNRKDSIIFDPLSETGSKKGDLDGLGSNNVAFRPTQSTYTPVRSLSQLSGGESSELMMHEWSLASLSKGPSISLPHSPRNPFIHQASVQTTVPKSSPFLSKSFSTQLDFSSNIPAQQPLKPNRPDLSGTFSNNSNLPDSSKAQASKPPLMTSQNVSNVQFNPFPSQKDTKSGSLLSNNTKTFTNPHPVDTQSSGIAKVSSPYQHMSNSLVGPTAQRRNQFKQTGPVIGASRPADGPVIGFGLRASNQPHGSSTGPVIGAVAPHRQGSPNAVSRGSLIGHNQGGIGQATAGSSPLGFQGSRSSSTFSGKLNPDTGMSRVSSSGELFGDLLGEFGESSSRPSTPQKQQQQQQSSTPKWETFD